MLTTQVETITLHGAREVAAAALAKAQEIDAAVIVTVVDAAGQVVVVERMDGVVQLAFDNALAKARAALTFKRSTRDLAEYFQEDTMLGPPMTAREAILAVEGGLPLTGEDGTIVGAIGISGAHHSVDDQIATAGSEALAPS